jgi:hypothetical protein
MGILDEVTGWVLVVLAVMTASGRLRELVRTRRSGARFSEVPDSVWSGLSFSLIWVGLGVNALLGPDPQWLGWFTTARLRPGYVRRDVDRLPQEISQATLA